MSEKVTMLKAFHRTKNFGNRENLQRQQARSIDLYRSLTLEEAGELARFAIDSLEPSGVDSTEEILRCLACFRPGSLVEFHEALVENGIFYPAMIYHGADAVTAARVVSLLPGEDTDKMLSSLAWIGDGVVQDAFNRWRSDPPEWSDRLFVPPECYSEVAGWELTPDGTRRRASAHNCAG